MFDKGLGRLEVASNSDPWRRVSSPVDLYGLQRRFDRVVQLHGPNRQRLEPVRTGHQDIYIRALIASGPVGPSQSRPITSRG